MEKITLESKKIKTVEEAAKLIVAICENNTDNVKNSISAVMNTLIEGAKLEGMTEEEITETISSPHTKKVDRDDNITYQIAMSVIGTLGCGIDTYRTSLKRLSARLALVAGHYGMTLEECYSF